MKLEHYFKRSEMWFDFLVTHPQYRTLHIIMKLYNKYMLDAVACHILLSNLNNKEN